MRHLRDLFPTSCAGPGRARQRTTIDWPNASGSSGRIEHRAPRESAMPQNFMVPRVVTTRGAVLEDEAERRFIRGKVGARWRRGRKSPALFRTCRSPSASTRNRAGCAPWRRPRARTDRSPRQGPRRGTRSAKARAGMDRFRRRRRKRMARPWRCATPTWRRREQRPL